MLYEVITPHGHGADVDEDFARAVAQRQGDRGADDLAGRITSYNVCYTKLLRQGTGDGHPLLLAAGQLAGQVSESAFETDSTKSIDSYNFV